MPALQWLEVAKLLWECNFILLPKSPCGFEKLTHITQFAPYV